MIVETAEAESLPRKPYARRALTAAAQRTRTRRQRAGGRRNKHLRDVGPQARDAPGRPALYYCDGTFAGWWL